MNAIMKGALTGFVCGGGFMAVLIVGSVLMNDGEPLFGKLGGVIALLVYNAAVGASAGYVAASR